MCAMQCDWVCVGVRSAPNYSKCPQMGRVELSISIISVSLLVANWLWFYFDLCIAIAICEVG